MKMTSAVVLAVLALAGCTTQIKDVTRAGAPRYAAISGRDIVTVTDLFVIREKKTNQDFLCRPEHGQLAPYRISEYRGRPLYCAGFMNGGSIVGVVKKGTRARIVRIEELHNSETGYFNRIYASILGSGEEATPVRIELLMRSASTSASFTNRPVIPDDRYLRFEPEE